MRIVLEICTSASSERRTDWFKTCREVQSIITALSLHTHCAVFELCRPHKVIERFFQLGPHRSTYKAYLQSFSTDPEVDQAGWEITASELELRPVSIDYATEIREHSR